MIRVLLVLGLVAGCSKEVTEAGRVVIDRSGKTVVVRDSMKVVELDLSRSSAGHAFEPLELPVIEFPGRLAIVDKARMRGMGVWITKLGSKRPANIQRWFDEKLSRLGSGAVVSDRVVPFRDHPGRVVDYVHDQSGRKTYQRFIGVDLPEHDLGFIMIAFVDTVAMTDKPKTEDASWLDDVVADVEGMRVAPGKP